MEQTVTELTKVAIEQFKAIYGVKPAAGAFAPGRVELLGNHTDYNEGYVLLSAIDRGTVFIGAPRNDGLSSVHSLNLGRTARFITRDLRHDPAEPWANYVKGVMTELQESGIRVPGFDGLIYGSIPLGSGLSSSAALEVSTALFIQSLAPYEMDRAEMARLCRRAENNFVGVPCGILDQFSSLFGEDNSAVFLDCRTYEHEVLPLPRKNLAIIVANTKTKHALVDGLYAKRRESCMAARDYFQKAASGITALRDVSVDLFMAHENKLQEEPRLRARHIVTENQRVLDGRNALRAGDADGYRRAMVGSHESSRDNFENSTPELDALIEIAGRQPGFHGGKLSGGGFGGCTVNLVAAENADDFERALKRDYTQRFGHPPELYRCRSASGARILDVA